MACIDTAPHGAAPYERGRGLSLVKAALAQRSILRPRSASPSWSCESPTGRLKRAEAAGAQMDADQLRRRIVIVEQQAAASAATTR